VPAPVIVIPSPTWSPVFVLLKLAADISPVNVGELSRSAYCGWSLSDRPVNVPWSVAT